MGLLEKLRGRADSIERSRLSKSNLDLKELEYKRVRERHPAVNPRPRKSSQTVSRERPRGGALLDGDVREVRGRQMVAARVWVDSLPKARRGRAGGVRVSVEGERCGEEDDAREAGPGSLEHLQRGLSYSLTDADADADIDAGADANKHSSHRIRIYEAPVFIPGHAEPASAFLEVERDRVGIPGAQSRLLRAVSPSRRYVSDGGYEGWVRQRGGDGDGVGEGVVVPRRCSSLGGCAGGGERDRHITADAVPDAVAVAVPAAAAAAAGACVCGSSHESQVSPRGQEISNARDECQMELRGNPSTPRLECSSGGLRGQDELEDDADKSISPASITSAPGNDRSIAIRQKGESGDPGDSELDDSIFLPLPSRVRAVIHAIRGDDHDLDLDRDNELFERELRSTIAESQQEKLDLAHLAGIGQGVEHDARLLARRPPQSTIRDDMETLCGPEYRTREASRDQSRRHPTKSHQEQFTAEKLAGARQLVSHYACTPVPSIVQSPTLDVCASRYELDFDGAVGHRLRRAIAKSRQKMCCAEKLVEEASSRQELIHPSRLPVLCRGGLVITGTQGDPDEMSLHEEAEASEDEDMRRALAESQQEQFRAVKLVERVRAQQRRATVAREQERMERRLARQEEEDDECDFLGLDADCQVAQERLKQLEMARARHIAETLARELETDTWTFEHAETSPNETSAGQKGSESGDAKLDTSAQDEEEADTGRTQTLTNPRCADVLLGEAEEEKEYEILSTLDRTREEDARYSAKVRFSRVAEAWRARENSRRASALALASVSEKKNDGRATDKATGDGWGQVSVVAGVGKADLDGVTGEQRRGKGVLGRVGARGRSVRFDLL